MESKSSKKKFYQKWWFWVIVIIIIASGIQGVKEEDPRIVDTETNYQTSSTANTEEKTEFKIGDVIAFDDKEFVVEGINRNWESGNQFIKPKAEKEFVLIKVKIENKSKNEMSYNKFDFKIEDSNGSLESPDFAASGDDDLGSGDLVPGGRKSGSLVFEVGKGDNLKLHYQPSFWSTRKVVVVLQ